MADNRHAFFIKFILDISELLFKIRLSQIYGNAYTPSTG